jgi:signal transduction histidine kinase
MKSLAFRNSGINSVGEIPWGTHFCYFYYTIEDLMDLIIPFIAEGLKNNELCLWITSPIINQNGAKEYLKKELANFSNLESQLKIYNYEEWYLKDNQLNLDKVVERLGNFSAQIQNNDALEGLRLVGDIYWLKKDHLSDFITYESKIEEQIKNHCQITLCTYPINKFIKSEVLSITFTHDFAIFKRKGKLKVIKSSEREKLEEEQRELHAQMQDIQKLHNIGILTNSFVHDFNNLLNVIKNNAELARLNIDSKQNIENYLHEISKSVKLSSELTHRFLGYSKHKSGESTFEEVNINKAIKTLASMLSYFIAENITLQTDLDPNLRTIKADSAQIEEVLMNLIINARDALPKGGKILVKTENIAIEDINKNIKNPSPHSKYVKIKVKDNGIGMDKETKKRLFEPFFTTKENGMGIGMTIIENFVKQNNGLIDVQSEKDVGTTFTLYFPAK